MTLITRRPSGGMKQLAEPMDLDDKTKIDVVVVGSLGFCVVTLDTLCLKAVRIIQAPYTLHHAEAPSPKSLEPLSGFW